MTRLPVDNCAEMGAIANDTTVMTERFRCVIKSSSNAIVVRLPRFLLWKTAYLMTQLTQHDTTSKLLNRAMTQHDTTFRNAKPSETQQKTGIAQKYVKSLMTQLTQMTQLLGITPLARIRALRAHNANLCHFGHWSHLQ